MIWTQVATCAYAGIEILGSGSNADRTGPDGPGCDDCDFGSVTCADRLKPAKIKLPQNLA